MLESPSTEAAMRRFANLAWLIILIIWSCAYSIAQSNPSPNPSDKTPEKAFISPSMYTNAFFGFSLTLPHGIPFRQLPIPSNQSSQAFLFGVQADLTRGAFNPHAAISVMEIMCKQAGGESSEEARKFVTRTKNLKATHITVGGKDFWKSQSEENGKDGKMHSISYAASLGEYAVEFAVVSFDAKLTGQLEHSIESITFFDPSKAAEIAGRGSRLYDPSGQHIAKLTPGTVWANTYTNDDLGFTYQFPSGWSVADEATREKVVEAGHQAAWGDSPSAAQQHTLAQKCARYLLMVNRYPVGTRPEGFNSGVALMAIDPACFPADVRFPSSLDDRQRATQLSEAIIALFADAPFFEKAQNSVTASSDAGHIWIEFSSTATADLPDHKAPLSVFILIDFTEVRDYWAAWMFMGGSQAELDQLKRTTITFSSSSPVP